MKRPVDLHLKFYEAVGRRYTIAEVEVDGRFYAGLARRSDLDTNLPIVGARVALERALKSLPRAVRAEAWLMFNAGYVACGPNNAVALNMGAMS